MDDLSPQEAERRAAVLAALRTVAVANDHGWTVMYPPPQVEGGHRGRVRTITLSFSMDLAHYQQAQLGVEEAMRRHTKTRRA